MPYFSLIIPTFNRAHLISKTLDSLKNQTFTDFEVLIIDDGSTDNTFEVIQPYLNNQFQYYKKENAERAAARNYGSKLAKGKYINWFDSDDLALPNHLEEAHLYLNETNYEVIHLAFAYLNANNLIYNDSLSLPKELNSILHKGNILSCNGVFVKKHVALKHLFNETRILSASEDYELWLRLASEYTIYHVKVISSYIVQHEERSVLTMTDATKLIDRFQTFIFLIKNNSKVTLFFGNKIKYLLMKNYLWLAVDLAVNGHKKLGFKYLIKAIRSNWKCLFQKSFFAVIKHLLITKF
jgi:glycosyltransferase involved in cell wall biosynthesis